MGPKVLAAIRFIENGGKRAAITERSRVLAAVEGKDGTQVYPD
jgi:carbamate kinase